MQYLQIKINVTIRRNPPPTPATRMAIVTYGGNRFVVVLDPTSLLC